MQSRQPKGIPTGGEFAAEAKGENPDLEQEPYRPSEEEVDTLAAWLTVSTYRQPINHMRRLAKEKLAAYGPNRSEADETTMRADAYRAAMMLDTGREVELLDGEIAELRSKRNKFNIVRSVSTILHSYPDATALTVRNSGGALMWWVHREGEQPVPFMLQDPSMSIDEKDRESWAEFAISYDGATTGDAALDWDAKYDLLNAATIDLSRFEVPGPRGGKWSLR